jgi:hypothetical protein
MTLLSPSHLDVLERRFLTLTAGTQPLTLDCAALGCGLPAQKKPLDEVRVLLLKRQTSWVTKNAVWQELVKLAHDMPDPWVTVAAAMMMPGLKHIGGKLGARYPGDRNDLDSEILEGFLQALDLAEPGTPKIYAQLYWAAFRYGHEACNRERRLAMCQSEFRDTAPSPGPRGGHPDLILAGAMLAGAVTPQQADLVSEVLLDHNRRSTVAAQRGMSRNQLTSQLNTAARHLVGYIRAEPGQLAA